MFINQSNKFDGYETIATVTIYSTASLGALFITLILGGLAAAYGFSEQSLALLASIDLIGLAAGSVLAVAVIKKANWYGLVAFGAMCIIIFNLFCVGESNYTKLCFYRFLAEFGAGLSMGVATAAIGDSERPEKMFSVAMAVIMALSIGTFLWLPGMMETQGVRVVFYAQLATGVAVLLALKWLPITGGKIFTEEAQPPLDKKSAYLLLLAMVNVAIFYIGQSVVLTLSERFGNFLGMDIQMVGNALAISMVTSFFGAVIANIVGLKFGRLLPTLIGLAIFIVGIFVLFAFDKTSYFIGMSLTQFAFSFAIVYLLLFAVEIDLSGRYAAILPAIQAGGYAVGPAIAAAFLGDNDYSSVLIIAIICLVLCTIIATPLVRTLDRIMKS